MLKTQKKGKNRLIFKNYSIMGPAIGLVAAVVLGIVLISTAEGDMLMLAIGAGACILGGVFAFFGMHITTITFDKSSGGVRYTKKGLRGAEEKTFSVSEIAGIRVVREVKFSSGGSKRDNNGPRAIFKYILEFNDGRSVMMGKVKKRFVISSMLFDSTPEAIRNVANFLGIPIEGVEGLLDDS